MYINGNASISLALFFMPSTEIIVEGFYYAEKEGVLWTMHSLPLADNLKDELHKVVLATQVNSAPDL